MNNKDDLFKYQEELPFWNPGSIGVIIYLGIVFSSVGITLLRAFDIISIPIILIGITIFVIIVLLCKHSHEKKLSRILDRKNAIIQYGTKVKGVAKKRASSLYVAFIHPETQKEIGFVTPTLVTKAMRDTTYDCDVFIYGDEFYACNYKAQAPWERLVK